MLPGIDGMRCGMWGAHETGDVREAFPAQKKHFSVPSTNRDPLRSRAGYSRVCGFFAVKSAGSSQQGSCQKDG